MDIKTLEQRLLDLDSAIKEILDITEYNRRHYLELVTYEHNNANDCMLYDEFCSIFTYLDYIHSILDYLQKPIIEEGIIRSVRGKYKLNKVKLDRNSTVEIYFFDKDTKTYRWHPILVKWCSNLDGERARIRG